MSVFKQLTVGVAEALAGAGLGTWSPTAALPASSTGIVVQRVPSSPDRLIVLSPYSIDDDATFADSTVGMQIRLRQARGGYLAMLDLEDAIFDLLHGRRDSTFGGVLVQTVTRRSSTSLGDDEQERPSWSSNYYFDLHDPSPLRL